MANRPVTITINRCPGCGVSWWLRSTGDKQHEPGCPVKAHRDAYNTGLRQRLDAAKGRAR